MSETTRRYLIPSATHEDEIEIERSRFIGTLGHATTADEARAFIETVRQRFPDATHHCWAFVAGPPGDSRVIGMSDDGEPSGTAGKPMLSVLMHSEVGEIVAVVTRYYGGRQLGTGGLVRAYTQAVQEPLASLPTREQVNTIAVEIEVQYPDYGGVERLFQDRAVEIRDTVYTDTVTVFADVPDDQWAALREKIVDQTAGSAEIREENDAEEG